MRAPPKTKLFQIFPNFSKFSTIFTNFFQIFAEISSPYILDIIDTQGYLKKWLADDLIIELSVKPIKKAAKKHKTTFCGPKTCVYGWGDLPHEGAACPNQI